MLADSVTGSYHYCWSKKYITKEGSEIAEFNALQFWFKTNSKKKISEPTLSTPFYISKASSEPNEQPTISKYPLEPDRAGNMKQRFDATGILSFKQLNSALFTKVYLADFFTAGELFYEGAYSKTQILTIRNNTKPVLYLINVINSVDTDIAVNCISDGKKISSYFKKVASFLEIPITEKKIMGKEFTTTAVRAAIKNIHPGKDDIVVFFYSGHGFSWKGDQMSNPFPELGLYYGRPPSWDHMGAFSINLEEIYKEIKAKNARLNLVMGDLCNTIVNRRRSELRDTAKEQVPPGYYDMNKQAAVELFLQTNASLLIAAAEKGQAANCSNTYDGFFTSGLLNSIRLGLKVTSNPQWNSIIQGAEAEISALALQFAKEDQNIIYRFCNAKNTFSCVEDLGIHK